MRGVRFISALTSFGGLALLLLGVAAIAVEIIISPPTINSTIDVSWPNCNHLPKSDFSMALIGVTGGLDFHVNPCAGNEASLANSYGIYINSGNPGFPRIAQKGVGPLGCKEHDLICYSYNYGYQSVRYAMRQAKLANLHATYWWIDVEAVNSWTNSKLANRADINGMLAALNAETLMPLSIGIYTVPDQWRSLVGDWSLGLPIWLGTGSTSIDGARSACGTFFASGMPVVLAQYTKGNLDYNVVCNPLNT